MMDKTVLDRIATYVRFANSTNMILNNYYYIKTRSLDQARLIQSDIISRCLKTGPFGAEQAVEANTSLIGILSFKAEHYVLCIRSGE
jgi:hypothetical protein